MINKNAVELTEKQIKNYLYENELGDARLLGQLFRDKVVYDHVKKTWFVFRDHVWVTDDTSQLRVRASEALRDLYFAMSKNHFGDEEIQKRIHKRLQSLTYLNKIERTLSYATSFLPFEGSWDAIPHKIACKNGVVNLMTGELEKGNPSDYLTYQMPVTHDKNATCPRFEKFLFEIFNGDTEIINFIQVLFGYGLIAATYEHILPIFHGPGGFNGKGVLLRAVRAVVGASCGSIPSSVLVDSNRNSNSSAAAFRLKDLRIAYGNETESGALLKSDRVKMLTGGDYITVKELYKDEYEIKPNFLLILLTNFLPAADSFDNALWQRIAVVKFEQRFVDDPVMENEHKIDVNLDAKLAKEKAGILNWLMAGAVKYYDNGLQIPDQLKLETLAYQESQDIVSEFVTDYCTLDPAAHVGSRDLYHIFRDIYPNTLKEREFGKAMMRSGFKKRKMPDAISYIGITSGKAIESKVEARSDIDTFLDLAGLQ